MSVSCNDTSESLRESRHSGGKVDMARRDPSGVQKELGLKPESQKSPVQSPIVDRAEAPAHDFDCLEANPAATTPRW
jgi:hypothetical protein